MRRESHTPHYLNAIAAAKAKKEEKKRRAKAARVIQQHWRAVAPIFRRERAIIDRRHYLAACVIQRAFRSAFRRSQLTQNLKFYSWLKRHHRRTMAKFRRIAWKVVWRIRIAVLTMQRSVLRWLTRHQYRHFVRTKAATVVQKCFRLHRRRIPKRS